MNCVYMVTWEWVGACADPWEHQEWGFYKNIEDACLVMNKLQKETKDTRNAYDVIKINYEQIDDHRVILDGRLVLNTSEFVLLTNDEPKTLEKLVNEFEEIRYMGESVVSSRK